MIVKLLFFKLFGILLFESSVNSYDSQTRHCKTPLTHKFESSVNSYDSQTKTVREIQQRVFESSVNSYDSQTNCSTTLSIS